jgi:hypothetical protein
MITVTQFFKILIRVCGGAALALGLAFWVGYAWSFTRLHMDLGMAVVVSLWLLAGIGWRNGAHPAFVAFAAAWGVLTWFVGFNQLGLLPGSMHWVIAVVHLFLGVTSVALGSRLATAGSVARAHAKDLGRAESRAPARAESKARSTGGREGVAG